MTSIHFSGGKETAAALEQLSKKMSDRVLREALRAGAAPMRYAMAALAPYDPTNPGVHLRNTIIVGNSRGRDRQEKAVAIGPSPVGFYAGFLEFGTVKMPPHAFMRPAFDETWRQSLAIIGKDLWQSLAERGVMRTGIETAPAEAGAGRFTGGRFL